MKSGKAARQQAVSGKVASDKQYLTAIAKLAKNIPMYDICLLRTTNAVNFQYENEDRMGRRVTCFDVALHGSRFTGYVILCGGYRAYLIWNSSFGI